MKLAINLSILPLEPTMRKLQENGVRYIEVRGNDLLDDPSFNTDAMRKTMADSNIEVWSVHAPGGLRYNLSSPDSEVRQHTLEEYRRLLQISSHLGVRIIVIHPSNHIGEGDRGECRQFLARILPDLLETAEHWGICLAVENMLSGCLCDSSEELLTLMTEIQSPRLGICFDTGHAHLTGGVGKNLKRLKDHIVTFHLQDNDGTRDLHLQPGFGAIPWHDFVGILRAMSFSDPLVIDAEPWAAADLSTLLEETALLLQHPGALERKPLIERSRNS